MLYSGAKKEALTIHGRAVIKYNSLFTDVQKKGEELYALQQQSIYEIEKIEELINSIVNTPTEFECSLEKIKISRMRFHETENYAVEAYRNAMKSGVSVTCGVGTGATVACLAPTAAMWVATTFGTASTGTAISTLSGAVAKKAALAWLGGGALSVGGAGIAGGKALLALAGPIGWGIAAIITTWSAFSLGRKNKKIANKVIEEAKNITISGAELNETGAIIANIHRKTSLLLNKTRTLFKQAIQLETRRYSSLSNNEQLLLCNLVNNTLSLSEMLNKIVE